MDFKLLRKFKRKKRIFINELLVVKLDVKGLQSNVCNLMKGFGCGILF